MKDPVRRRGDPRPTSKTGEQPGSHQDGLFNPQPAPLSCSPRSLRDGRALYDLLRSAAGVVPQVAGDGAPD
ncbi:hypothetical protein CHELA1G11_10909 [Hyphomicrobiales bacterium]|nr:hypothetical protein CHELA1G11_10909 [Hyphomicrobiales bacterium]